MTKETYRKIIIHFKSEEAMNSLSDKLFQNSENKLLRNMTKVKISENDAKFTYKRSVYKKPRIEKEWESHWVDFFPFSPEKKVSWAKIEFQFSNYFTLEKLSDIFGQNVTIKTNSLHYPIHTEPSENLHRIIGTRGNPQYPIYIISKGRSDCCITADHLIKMDVPFRIVIEKSEWEDYLKYYDESLLLELDLSHRDTFDTYIKDFDENKSKGSGPARNFVWEHAKASGAKWHWIMDDNIYGFNYFFDQMRLKAVDGTVFSVAEDFVNRYENIGIAGLNYYAFAIPGSKDRPYVANTKIYSCLLIKNEIPIRWAGRYNEDVDLCIRALKHGYSTIQFDGMLAKKAATQTMGGGNTDAFYAEEGTLPKSNMLAYQHPDITHVQWRYQRWHHMTNYDVFDVYKDRSIGDTIEAMSKPQLLNPDEYPSAIKEILELDYRFIKDWNVLKMLPEPQRTEIIDVLKTNKSICTPEELVKLITSEPLINCDYYNHIWGSDIDDTVDNRLMMKLLALGENGMLKTAPTQEQWNAVFSEFDDAERKDLIIKEMVRNKYLRHAEYPKYEYNLKMFTLNDEDHAGYYDSKARIINKFVNDETVPKLPEPETFFDRRMRTPVKTKKRTFKANLVSRHTTVTRNDNYTLMIHGTEDFDDLDVFNEINVGSNVDEIINSVYYPVDLMSANYALEHRIKNKEFVPDESLYSKDCYKKMYEQMVDYADECILFVGTSTPDTEYLIDLFNKAEKKITVIKTGTQTESFDDSW